MANGTGGTIILLRDRVRSDPPNSSYSIGEEVKWSSMVRRFREDVLSTEGVERCIVPRDGVSGDRKDGE